jgi:hypothetical protein
MEDSIHFAEMLHERRIELEWVDRAIREPDRIEKPSDGTRHFIKQIPDYGDRWLRVVVNITTNPERRVTAFFDRRLGRTT